MGHCGDTFVPVCLYLASSHPSVTQWDGHLILDGGYVNNLPGEANLSLFFLVADLSKNYLCSIECFDICMHELCSRKY